MCKIREREILKKDKNAKREREREIGELKQKQKLDKSLI